METQAVLERLDACIHFLSETKQFIISATKHGVTEEVATVTLPVEADPHPKKTKAAAPPVNEPDLDLSGYSNEELEGILTDNDVEVPAKVKGKDRKKSLTNAILQAIAEGKIMLEEDASEDEDAESTDSDGEDTDSAGEEDTAEANDEDSEEGDSEGDDEDGEPVDDSSDTPDTEYSAIEEFIRNAVGEGTIKLAEMKKTLSTVFADDPNCKECKGCDREETLTCYVQTMEQVLTDDEGETHLFDEPYIRDEEVYCCGMPCKETTEKKELWYVCQGHCKSKFQLQTE